MYLYFDSHGKLVELVNDENIRQGSTHNYIYVYMEGVSFNGTKYPLPSSYSAANLDYLLIEETDKSTYEDVISDLGDVVITDEIPFNKKRDLKFFKYGYKYDFWRFEVPNDLTLSKSGTIGMSITFHPGTTVLGMILFEIEAGAMQETVPLDYAGYNYLLEKFADKVNRNETIYRTDDITSINVSQFSNGQIFYLKNNTSHKLFIKSAGVLTEFFDFNKIVMQTDVGKRIYATNQYGDQTTLGYSSSVSNNAIVQRDNNGQVKVPTNPTSDNDATSKSYVERKIRENIGRHLWANEEETQDFQTKEDLDLALHYYSNGESVEPQVGDYAYVIRDENHDDATTQYKYTGTIDFWKLEIIVEHKPLTQAQLNALNSGITSTKVTQYDSYATGKQDTISDLTDIRNNASAGKTASDSLVDYRTSADQDIIDNEIRAIANGKNNTFTITVSATDSKQVIRNAMSGHEDDDNYKVYYYYRDTNGVLVTKELNKRTELANLPSRNYNSSIYSPEEYAYEQTIVIDRISDGFLLRKTVVQEGVDLRYDVFNLRNPITQYKGCAFRVDDNIRIVETNIPDRWVSSIEELGTTRKIVLNALESLVDAYSREEADEKFPTKEGSNGFDGVQYFYDTIYLTSIADYNNQSNVIPASQLIEAIGTTIIDNSTTAVSRALMTNNTYIYKQPLTSLAIASLEALSQNVFREWRISFKVASSFTISLPSGSTFKWAMGEPIWDTDTTYTLVITDGIDTDFIIYVVRG